MSTLILELTGFLCTYKIMMLLILIVLEWNIFQKRLEHLSKMKTEKQIFFKIQAYDLIMCEYFCILFIDFMLAKRF